MIHFSLSLFDVSHGKRFNAGQTFFEEKGSGGIPLTLCKTIRSACSISSFAEIYSIV